jgi:hypothetical protein
MKKVLLLTISLIFSLTTFSQARLGYTEKSIREEFPNYTFTTGYTDDGLKYISTEDFDEATVLYYFTNENKCYGCIIIPYNTGKLNYYVEQYNKKYVIISETEWKAYTENGIMTIKLTFEGKPGFMIY